MRIPLGVKLFVCVVYLSALLVGSNNLFCEYCIHTLSITCIGKTKRRRRRVGELGCEIRIRRNITKIH